MDERTIERCRMPTSIVFNPSGDDSIETRQIWFGNTTNLMQLNDVRYSWARSLYRQMREQFWIPEKTNVTQDINDYGLLTPEERRAFDGILSYLTFLDSIQTANIPHLKTSVTAPEVSLCMAEQLSQEAMHNAAYQYVIETIIPHNERDRVYEFWRSDGVLLNRCTHIAGAYKKYVDCPTEEHYFDSLIADYILEGLYFYNGFVFFYNLGSRQRMPGTADIIKLINRDELSHVRLYQMLIPEAMKVFPHSKERIYELFDSAVTQECLWAQHIIGDSILGITGRSIETYTKYLANIRLRAIGLSPLYPDARYKKNPYAHLERFADTSSEATTKANFFEAGSVTSYNTATAVEGWDDIFVSPQRTAR